MVVLLTTVDLLSGFQIFENVVDVVVCDGLEILCLLHVNLLSKLIRSFLDEEGRRNALRKTGAITFKRSI